VAVILLFTFLGLTLAFSLEETRRGR